MNETNRRMAAGAIWMVGFKLVERSIGLVSTVILARLLVPADFGLVAMAMVVVAILELFGAFSFDVALIQNQNADREYFDTAWTLNVLLSASYAIVLCLLAHPAAQFYEEPRLEAVMYWLSIGQFVIGFDNIGVVAFRKELRFDREFRLLLAKKIVSFMVTVPLAFLLRNYWALVAGMLVGRMGGTAITYLVHPYRPRFCFAKHKELFHFSKWLLINNALYFLSNKISDFVIGKVSGASVLGVYSISCELANMPTTELIAPINRAVLPGYSIIGRDLVALKRSFLEVTGIITVLAIPVGLGLAVLAEPLVLTVLGAKWAASVLLIQVLVGNGLLAALGTNLGPVFIALGAPRVLTLTTTIHVSVLVPLVVLGAYWGDALGVCLAVLGTGIIVAPIGWGIVLNRLDLPWYQVVREIWRPIVAGTLMVVVVSGCRAILATKMDVTAPAIHLLLGICIGAIAYVALLLALWRVMRCPTGAEQRVLRYLVERLHRQH